MAKLSFHGVFLLILVLLTLTVFDITLGDKGMVTSSKLGKSNGKDLLPLRFKFKQFDPPTEEEDCNDKTCETGEADDCDLRNCGTCIEGYNICSNPPPPVDCYDTECTPPATPEEDDECFNHEGCGYCDENYNVCTSLYD